MPGFEGFQREGWHFLIDEYMAGARIQTHQEDERIVCATADFEANAGWFYASAERLIGGDQWRWEVENAGGIEGAFEYTLSAAIAAATAFVTRSFRTGRIDFVAT
ncbi:hypothetical protein ASC80_22625 [Afipia sp. Root123D2]|nr:hypothetical protein ASC80_22625 [Afipia sp. Root123D2]